MGLFFVDTWTNPRQIWILCPFFRGYNLGELGRTWANLGEKKAARFTVAALSLLCCAFIRVRKTCKPGRGFRRGNY